ncbi:MAG: hypothetical protein A2V88_03830 [Elusimicrobia bacterium RBG_16_66_12]|nr:MAG: hypothetical protein A2V88_03830 [Elusimicrobia bacterium RBG_16_66_12]
MGGRRPRLSILRGGAVVFLACLLAACGGPSGSMRKEVNGLIAARDFAGAEARIVKEKQGSYGKKNQVLYYLDLGAVQHDGGKYKESDQSFETAETRMEELFTKSVSKAAGTLLLNDNTTEYAGERFERALVNVYRALGYLFRSDREGALVEIRKLSRLLQEYADVYGAKSTAYKDDAFAQYLSSLLYADDGKTDDARISLDKSKKVYEFYAASYGTPAPRFDFPADDAQARGELVFLHLNGTAPRKISKTFSVAWNEAVVALNSSKDDEKESAQAQNALRAGLIGKAVTVAYPAYTQDPFQIASSQVECAGQKAETQLMEDVSAIAMKDLAERQALIKVRAIARATVKYILAKAAADAVAKKYGKNSWQALAAQVGGSAVAAATEIADTRAWATLPSQFRMARMRLPPGTHDVTVSYTSPTGSLIATRTFKAVSVKKGGRTYLHDRTAL